MSEVSSPPGDGRPTIAPSADRAVSEVLSYILVFALVVATISLIMVSGLGSLEDARDTEQVANAERAFDVMADNMASIYERNSPSRSTEIDTGDAEIFFSDPVSITLRLEDGSQEEIFQHSIRPIVFTVDGERNLVYEGGAVFRTENDGGIVLRDPPMLFSEQRLHVPFIKTTAEGVRSVGGTTVLVRGQATERAVLLLDSDADYDRMVISVTSPRYELWERYLSERTGVEDCSIDQAANRVECRTDNPTQSTVHVTLQQIELSLVR